MYLPSGYSVVKLFTLYSRIFWYSLNNCHFVNGVNLVEKVCMCVWEAEIKMKSKNSSETTFSTELPSSYFSLSFSCFSFFSSLFVILVLKIFPAFTALCNWKIYANAIIICYLVFPCTYSIPSIHKSIVEIHILCHMQCMHVDVEYIPNMDSVLDVRCFPSFYFLLFSIFMHHRW